MRYMKSSLDNPVDNNVSMCHYGNMHAKVSCWVSIFKSICNLNYIWIIESEIRYVNVVVIQDFVMVQRYGKGDNPCVQRRVGGLSIVVL